MGNLKPWFTHPWTSSRRLTILAEMVQRNNGPAEMQCEFFIRRAHADESITVQLRGAAICTHAQEEMQSPALGGASVGNTSRRYISSSVRLSNVNFSIRCCAHQVHSGLARPSFLGQSPRAASKVLEEQSAPGIYHIS